MDVRRPVWQLRITPKIVAPINAQQQVRFLPLGDLNLVEITLKSEPICAIIIECIQGVGGLDESTTRFL